MTVATPEQPDCESCHETIADDAEAFDCPRYSGPIHVGCHPADCRSVECREALDGPWEE